MPVPYTIIRRSAFPSPYPRRRNVPGFALAYGLVSLSGLSMGLLLGWVMWG